MTFEPGDIEVLISAEAPIGDGMWLSLREVQGNAVRIWPPEQWQVDPDDDRCCYGKDQILAWRSSKPGNIWLLVQR